MGTVGLLVRGRQLGLIGPVRPLSVVFIERGEIDVLDGAFVVVDLTGIRTHIPVGGVANVGVCSPRTWG